MLDYNIWNPRIFTIEEFAEIPQPTETEDAKAHEVMVPNLEESTMPGIQDANETEEPENPEENPEDPATPNKKSIKGSKKLIIDATTKILGKNIEKQMVTWDALVVKSPRDTFFNRMLDIKMNLNNLVPFPLHRKMSDKLLFLYQRNLKKVPLNLTRSLKKTSNDQERVTRYKLRGKDAVKIEDNQEMIQIADNQPEIPQNPEIPEIPQLEQSEVPQIPQIPDSELPAFPQTPEVQGITLRKSTENSPFQKYNEK